MQPELTGMEFMDSVDFVTPIYGGWIDLIPPDCLNITSLPVSAGVTLHMGVGRIGLPVDIG